MRPTAAGLTYWFYRQMVKASFCSVSPWQRLFSMLALFTGTKQSNGVITLPYLFYTASQRSAVTRGMTSNTPASGSAPLSTCSKQCFIRSDTIDNPLLRWRVALKTCSFSKFWVVFHTYLGHQRLQAAPRLPVCGWHA